MYEPENHINNNIKKCPYCNQTMLEEIFNDHLICHQLDFEQNTNSQNNINHLII